MKPLALLLFAAAAGETPWPEIVIPAVAHASVLTAADVNHDARPDLIVADSDDGNVAILLNDGGGKFHPAPGSPFACGPQPNDFAVADFNHDGHPDLAIVNT